MAKVFFSLGSNLGNKTKHLNDAIAQLNKHFELCQVSKFYESKAWGYESSNTYVNCAVLCLSNVPINKILQIIMTIEHHMGRQREGEGYADRVIDIDIALVDDLVFETELVTVPHPRMHLRDFVLKPLLDIEDCLHPVLNKKCSHLLKQLNEQDLVVVDGEQ